MAIGVIGFQLAAVVAPPTNSNAAGSSDLIYGGFKDKTDFLRIFDGPGDGSLSDIAASQLRDIYAEFGINRQAVANAEELSSTNSGVTGSTPGLLTVGRNHYFADDVEHIINSYFGVQKVYVRPLSHWGISKSYSVLKGVTTSGAPFAIVKDCGNVVIWNTPPPPPVLTISKVARADGPAAGSTVLRGQILKYHVDFHNTGGSAANVLTEDAIPANTTLLSYSTTKGDHRGVLAAAGNVPYHTFWAYDSFAAGQSDGIDMDVAVNADAPNGAQICNYASTKADNFGQISSNQVCHTVSVPPPPPPQECKPGIPVGDARCLNPAFECVKLDATPTDGTAPVTVVFKTHTAATDTTVVRYDFNFGDGTKVTETTPDTTYTYNKPGTFKATVAVNNTDSATGAKTSVACAASINIKAPTPHSSKLIYDKTAINLSVLTGSTPIDANNTTASAGDKIQYTLTAKNVGDAPEKAFVFEENVSDILEYADIIDPGNGTLKTNAQKQQLLTWPAADIAADATATHVFTVQAKNPIPSTARGVSDPSSFDLTMDNAFHGSAVSVKLPPPPIKQIEVTTEKLPQTGGAGTIIITIAFAALCMYFYFRNRQLAGELKTLSSNYHPGAI